MQDELERNSKRSRPARQAFPFPRTRAGRSLARRSGLPLILLALGLEPPALASYRAAATPPPQRAALRAEPVASWGCADCAGAELLTSVLDISVTPSGRVFVTDAAEPLVRSFAPDGAATYAFGRKGQGPGEMGLPAWIQATSGGVQVLDMTQRRLIEFASDGTLRGMQTVATMPSAAAYDPVSGGWYLASPSYRATPVSTRLVHYHDGATRTVIDSLVDFPVQPDGSPALYYPIAARPEGGLAVGDGYSEYRIRLLDDAGAVVAEITRELDREPRSETELEVERERIAAARQRLGGRVAASPESGAGRGPVIDPLRRHFYMNALEYDGAGRLWVLTGRGDWGASVFDVFDPRGSFLGEVVVDAEVRHFALAGDWLAAACLADDELPVIHLWRLSGSG